MKLEVGMYVRTKRGQIGKITTIGKDNVAIEFNGMWQDIVSKKNIVKEPSFDFLDLIEAGDVISLSEDIDNFKKEYIIGIPDLITLDAIKEKIENGNLRLVGIVTKERFENIEYKFVN